MAKRAVISLHRDRRLMLISTDLVRRMVEQRRSYPLMLPFRVMRMDKISVYYLCVPFAEHSEQPASIVQCFNGVPLICRFDGVLKPVGDAWICKDLFESHIY